MRSPCEAHVFPNACLREIQQLAAEGMGAAPCSQGGLPQWKTTFLVVVVVGGFGGARPAASRALPAVWDNRGRGLARGTSFRDCLLQK